MEQQIIEGTANFVSPDERARLVLFCARMTGNIDIAEDLAQETLLEAWRHLDNLRDQSRRRQWLCGIARNVCMRWQRKHGRDAAHFIDSRVSQDPQPSVSDDLDDLLTDELDVEIELERQELIELLDRALALLPAETRAILVKRYVEESPLAVVAAELGMNVSAVAMRLQRGKLALRRVLTSELRQEIAPYAFPSSSAGTWEQTPLWCHLCGQHRLLGIRNPDEGKLLLKCPGCTPGADEILSYNELPLLKGISGFKPLMTRLRNWCSPYYWTGLRDGVSACVGCGRTLPVRIIRVEDMPDWVRENDYTARWTCQPGERLVAIPCEHCLASSTTVLESLVLGLPEGLRFQQAHPRMRTLPNQEVECAGRRAIVSRFESVTGSAGLAVVSDYETYRTLRIDGDF